MQGGAAADCGHRARNEKRKQLSPGFREPHRALSWSTVCRGKWGQRVVLGRGHWVNHRRGDQVQPGN